MNRLIAPCALASAIAIITILIAKFNQPSVTLRSSDWQCVDTAPNGLDAECIQYTRKPKQQVRG
jgi:hypothetical protein